jgi:hypothetical protein
MTQTKESIRPSTVAVVAGMIAAVKFARLDFSDQRLMNSPMARSIISHSVSLARRIIEATYSGEL